MVLVDTKVGLNARQFLAVSVRFHAKKELGANNGSRITYCSRDSKIISYAGYNRCL